MSAGAPAPDAESLADPLAACLAQVARLLGAPMSAQALVTGFTVNCPESSERQEVIRWERHVNGEF